jgi:hypothetical protein
MTRRPQPRKRVKAAPGVFTVSGVPIDSFYPTRLSVTWNRGQLSGSRELVTALAGQPLSDPGTALERVMTLEASRLTLRRSTLARACRELPAAYATSIAAPHRRYGVAEGERESTIRAMMPRRSAPIKGLPPRGRIRARWGVVCGDGAGG